MNKWEIYDRLIEAIPDELTAVEVVCGMTWTMVRSSDDAIGLAMTTNVCTLPAEKRGFAGMPLKEAARQVKSWNLIEAGIGMAAINAYYNSERRLNEMNTRQNDKRFCTFDIPFGGKNVTMVGNIRHPEGMFDSAKSLRVLERSIVPGTYPDSAAEYYIPDSELVIITGSAFVNKTMPRLLELADNADVIITGPSTPMSPVMFEYGVRRLTGLVITDKKGCFDFVTEGVFNTPYKFGERFALSKY